MYTSLQQKHKHYHYDNTVYKTNTFLNFFLYPVLVFKVLRLSLKPGQATPGNASKETLPL